MQDSNLRQNVNPHAQLVPSHSNRSALQIEQQQQQQGSLTDRIRDRMTASNIQKVLLFLFMTGIVIWIGATYFSPQALLKRQPTQISSSNVVQMAAPDQMTLRSYYLYNQLMQLAKKRAIDPKSVPETFYKDYENITFWEIFTMFKVVRSYQIANECGQQPVDVSSDANIFSDEHPILRGSVNMSQVFHRIPIQNQGGCASCYSFPIAATIEYLYAINNISIKLSQQQIIDCARVKYSNEKANNENINQCQDGNMTRGFEYAMEQGLVQAKYYPYQSAMGMSNQCRVPENVTRYKISGFVKIPKDCKYIIDVLNRGFPVAAMIHGSPLSFWNKKQPFEDCKRDQPNHAITILGIYENNNYYVRNSWGRNWGWEGYFELKAGNTCGACRNGAVFPYLIFEDGKPKSASSVIRGNFTFPQLTEQQKKKIWTQDKNDQQDDGQL